MNIVIEKARSIKRNIEYLRKRWKPPFQEVSIESPYDKKVQKAYFYPAKSTDPQPLVVSLHTWGTTYKKLDPVLSSNAVKHDWNYIFPDFRGVNNSPEAVGSEMSLSDINDAIGYCIENSNVDFDNIFIVGGSGGAYAALCFYSSTKYNINSYIAWSPITDLIAWHDQSLVRGTRYANDIKAATQSADELNVNEAKKRSPLYRDFPQTDSKFYLFSGYHDGADQGPVPLSHTLDFYNKFAQDHGAGDSDLISKDNYIKLLTREIPPNIDEQIDGRPIVYSKSFNNISIVIFDGGHDHLANHTVKLIKENIKTRIPI